MARIRRADALPVMMPTRSLRLRHPPKSILLSHRRNQRRALTPTETTAAATPSFYLPAHNAGMLRRGYYVLNFGSCGLTGHGLGGPCSG
eukprot:scaffold411013_cov54-Prasinocladus_malaysianus.AAC.2